MNAIRESIPTEAIIRAYMDESVEEEEEVIIENIEEPVPEPIVQTAEKTVDDVKIAEDNIPSVVPAIQNMDNENVITRLSFNDMDSVLDSAGKENEISAPKTIERLEEISTNNAFRRKLEEEEDSSDDEDDKIKIHTDMIDLSGFDVLDDISSNKASSDFVLDGIEEL